MKLVKEFPDSGSQEEWLARERAHLSQVLYRYTPLVIDRAQGSYLFTVDGRRYLDFASGIGVTNLGHGHPQVLKAAHEQLDKLMHISVVAHHQPAIELAERIAALTGFSGELLWDRGQPDGQPRRRLDTSRARDRFGFDASTRLEDGLRRTIDWFRARVHEPGARSAALR